MTHPDERVKGLLTQLAGQADGHVVPERVTDVHRRARRTRAVRTSVAAGALAVAVTAVVGVRSGDLPWRRAQVPDPARPAPTPSAALTVDVRQDQQATDTVPNRYHPAAQAVIVIHVHGLVPARPVAAKDVTESGREHLLGLRISGWGGFQGSTTEPADCRPGAPLLRVDDEFPYEMHFEKPGRYPVTVAVQACDPVGTVTRTVTVDARVTKAP